LAQIIERSAVRTSPPAMARELIRDPGDGATIASPFFSAQGDTRAR